MSLKRIGLLALTFVLVAALAAPAMAVLPFGDEGERFKVKFKGRCIGPAGKGERIKSDKNLHMRTEIMKTEDGIVDFALVTFFLSGKKVIGKPEVGRGQFYFDFPDNYEFVDTGMFLNCPPEGGDCTDRVEKLLPKACDGTDAETCVNNPDTLVNGWIFLASRAFKKTAPAQFIPEFIAAFDISRADRDKKKGIGNGLGLAFVGTTKCPTDWKFKQTTK